jgi:disease resistance protein RPM1
VIDDLRKIEFWETIKLAFDDENDCVGRIIITTRNMKVAEIADEVYELQALPYDSSRELLFKIIAGPEANRYDDNQEDEISDKFISKCGGIPLAIITMASVLACKQREDWSELYETIGFDFKDAKEAMTILSFSYYDLPSNLRTCLLYLSAFPEDSFIPKESLVWMWIAEGFVVDEKKGIRLFEIGEGYFNDLINRSLIQAVADDYDDSIILGCRVHDMVLDWIRLISSEEIFFTVVDKDNTLDQNNVY